MTGYKGYDIKICLRYRNYDINPGYKGYDIKICVSYRNYDINPGYRGYDTDIYIQKNTSYCGHCHEY